MCNSPAQQHPRLRKADAVVLVTSESLNALQPLDRLCRRLSGLAQANVTIVLHVGSRPKQADSESLSLDLRAHVSDLQR